MRKPQKSLIVPISFIADLTSPIEAEDFSDAEGDFQTVGCGSCSGGNYMQFLSGSPGDPGSTSMLYRVKVTNGSPVYLHLLGSGVAAQSNAFLVSVDSGPDIPAAVTAGDWGWTTAQSPLAMPDGVHDVYLKPVISGVKLDKIVFSKSSRPPVEASLPKLDGIQVNGNPVSDFSPTTYSYTVKLPFGTTGVPVVTAASSHLVEITQPQNMNGTSVIYVRDRQDPYFYSRYDIQLTGYPVYGSIPVGLMPFPVSGVTSSPGYSGSYPPKNTIDGNLSTRWAAKGEHWIQFDLGESKPVKYALIAFLNGERTVYKFDMDVSEDGAAWKRVYSGGSSGKSADLELFTFEENPVRYLRFSGHGNNNDTWNNMNEIFIAGQSVATRLELPAVDGVYSDTSHLRAILTDTAGIPLPGKEVVFSVGDTVIGKSATGASGEALLDYRVNIGADAAAESKEYDLKAQYAGKPDRTILPSDVVSKLIVHKEQAGVEYTGQFTAVSQNVTLSAAVRQQDDGQPGVVDALPVRFDMKQYQKDGSLAPYTPSGPVSVTTDAYGQARLISQIPAGLYEVNTVLSANPYYKDASSTVTLAVYSSDTDYVLGTGFIELPANTAFFGAKAKKMFIESAWGRKPGIGMTGYARIHAEPQGPRLDMHLTDWMITAGGAAYVQGRATDEQGAMYTVRLIMGTNQNKIGQSNLLSMMIWKGTAAAGQPGVTLTAQDFKGILQIR